ncbi:MAG: hypothetical protein EZS28_038676, partial [Streblomastix strix]
MEWLDSLTYTPKYINQYHKQQLAQQFSQQNKSQNNQKAENKDQEELTKELNRIVADRSNDNGDEDQSEHTIEPQHFTNENDGLRKNDIETQLRSIVNGESNLEINT